jgi:hypothetical protein
MIRIFKLLGAFLIATSLVCAPTASFAGVFIGISVNFGPPALPVYVQPPCPAPDLIWTPGYWAYAPDGGYYWVPGAWVAAPEPGYLYTPGYWAYAGGAYGWHPGYWGPHVGFYGGVNYGFGYFGSGFYGGGWYGNHFRYNTAYANVDRTVINNVYVNRTTVINNYNNRVSYNGGPGGIAARPTAQELAYTRESHVAETPDQRRQVESAAANRAAFANVNHGSPSVAAYARPGERPVSASRFEANTASEARPSYATGGRPDAFARFNNTPNEYRPAGSATRPQADAYHAQTSAYHPQGSSYRTQGNAYRTQGSAYRTQGNAYRPQSAGGRPQAYRAARGGAPHAAAVQRQSPHDR